MKLFVVLILAVFSGASFSYAADFDETDPSTWNESHKIAARFEYCGWVIEIICPQNMKGVAMRNPFAKPKHACPNFNSKYLLAKELFRENNPTWTFEHSKITTLLRRDLERARTMGTLDIPLSAYDNCQNDVEEYLADKYKPTFDLKSFND